MNAGHVLGFLLCNSYCLAGSEQLYLVLYAIYEVYIARDRELAWLDLKLVATGIKVLLELFASRQLSPHIHCTQFEMYLLILVFRYHLKADLVEGI